jgi:hypothetical protein
MLFQCHFAFLHKGRANVRTGFTNSLPFNVRICLWEGQAEENDKDGRTRAEPE